MNQKVLMLPARGPYSTFRLYKFRLSRDLRKVESCNI